LNGSALTLELEDPRKEWAKPITEPQVMTQGEEDAYPQKLPEDFDALAKERLARVTGTKGPKLTVKTQVRRVDVTFYNDKFRGDFVRYDVVLGFRVVTSTGALLNKGSGASWQELASEQATPAQMKRVFSETAIAALDRYFASEDTLDTINEQIARYLETHPNER
jgi:hypothetical protein